MAKTPKNQYEPDVVSPPGETLQETLEALGMSQSELAKRTGRPVKTINEIIHGKEALTPETALQFERALGVPASFWDNRERDYREHLARERERNRLERQVEWLRTVPVRAMINLKWIREFRDKVRQLQECLNFFGVVSPDQWQELWGSPQAAFRKSPAFRSDPGSVAAWLRKGELEAQGVHCAPYDSSRFKKALLKIRGLTREGPDVFQKEMFELCREAGVAVVLVHELPKSRASGATRWLTKDKALTQLSLRYKTNDQFWFTFFHESGHILKHGKSEIFIEDHGMDDEKEQEADQFAASALIPPSAFRKLREIRLYSRQAVRGFAEEAGIAPGIVVGRLQHEGLVPHKNLNGLKTKFTWAEE